MAVFKELSANDIKVSKSYLNQLVDMIQEDISGSATRKKYQVFVTGGVGPGVTSSLFQTVYDQNHSLQTANPLFDMTVGLYVSGTTVMSSSTGVDSAGKRLFPSSSLMMREKVDIYRQFAQTLLGNADSQFYSPLNATDETGKINEGLFISFKRLFHRDSIKRESFGLKFYRSASLGESDLTDQPNLITTSTSGSVIYTDVGSAANKEYTFGGQVGNIVDSANSSYKVGLMFYDRGVAILDLKKIVSGSQKMSGTIKSMSPTGTSVLGVENTKATFIPDFVVSASIDDIVDHIASTRFSSGTLTGITFQNITNINSTLIFARLGADEFNYSSNPTYTDASNRIVVIDEGQEENQKSFTFITTVGLYDANDNLLAVAKLSRPIEKNDEKDLTIRTRLDF